MIPPIRSPTSTHGFEIENATLTVLPASAACDDQLVRVGVEEHERGEAGRADRVALGDGLRGVADRVERIGDAAHRLGHVRHLGDAARVVGDRPEGVERDDHAGQREHRDGGQRDARDVAELVGHEDADADHEHREPPWPPSTSPGPR